MPSFINTLLNIYAVFHNLYQALIWIWNKIQNSHRRTVRESSQWPDNHDGVITHLEPDILECEVKWALGSITMNKIMKVMEFQLSYLKSWKMMLLKCCPQYVSKFVKGNAKNVQFTIPLHSFHMLAKSCSKSFQLDLTVHELRTSRHTSWI